MDNHKLISIDTTYSSNTSKTPIKLDFNFISTPYIEKKAIYDIQTFIEKTENKLFINTSK